MRVMQWLFGRNARREAARQLYERAVRQARSPALFDRFGVPDTLNGRFDMIVLHVFLLLHRCGDEPKAAPVAQGLCDALVDDLDRNLREMGVGDLSVGKKVKRLAEGFYGRLDAYEGALQKTDGDLEGVLRRNLFASAETVGADQIAAVADYVRRQATALESQPLERMVAGEVVFEPVEADRLASGLAGSDASRVSA